MAFSGQFKILSENLEPPKSKYKGGLRVFFLTHFSGPRRFHGKWWNWVQVRKSNAHARTGMSLKVFSLSKFFNLIWGSRVIFKEPGSPVPLGKSGLHSIANVWNWPETMKQNGCHWRQNYQIWAKCCTLSFLRLFSLEKKLRQKINFEQNQEPPQPNENSVFPHSKPTPQATIVQSFRVCQFAPPFFFCCEDFRKWPKVFAKLKPNDMQLLPIWQPNLAKAHQMAAESLGFFWFLW